MHWTGPSVFLIPSDVPIKTHRINLVVWNIVIDSHSLGTPNKALRACSDRNPSRNILAVRVRGVYQLDIVVDELIGQSTGVPEILESKSYLLICHSLGPLRAQYSF